MPEAASHPDPLDLAHVDDPVIRRALRTMYQEFSQTLHRHQAEIDALVETLMEKHVTSLGEFKRIVARLQQDTTRMKRIEGAIASAATPPQAPH